MAVRKTARVTVGDRERVVAVDRIQRVGLNTVPLVASSSRRHYETEAGNPRRLDGTTRYPPRFGHVQKTALTVGFFPGTRKKSGQIWWKRW